MFYSRNTVQVYYTTTCMDAGLPQQNLNWILIRLQPFRIVIVELYLYFGGISILLNSAILYLCCTGIYTLVA